MNIMIDTLLTNLLGSVAHSFTASALHPACALLELSQNLPKELDRFAILLPPAATLDNTGDEAQALIAANCLDAIIRLPAPLPWLCLFNRHKWHKLVLFVDAEGKTLDELLQSKIAGAYRRAQPPARAEVHSSSPVCYAEQFNRLEAGVLIDGLAYLASLEEIAAGGFNLNPQHYVR